MCLESNQIELASGPTVAKEKGETARRQQRAMKKSTLRLKANANTTLGAGSGGVPCPGTWGRSPERIPLKQTKSRRHQEAGSLSGKQLGCTSCGAKRSRKDLETPTVAMKKHLYIPWLSRILRYGEP